MEMLHRHSIFQTIQHLLQDEACSGHRTLRIHCRRVHDLFEQNIPGVNEHNLYVSEQVFVTQERTERQRVITRE